MANACPATLGRLLAHEQSCPAGQAGGVCVRINELPGSANLPGNREPESESRGATALELSELGGHGDNKVRPGNCH